MAQAVHQAAVSFALLATALLLVTTLFADVQDGIEALDNPFMDRFIPDDPSLDGLEEHADSFPHGSLEGLRLDDAMELELPAGTHIDGDEIILAENLRIELPAGSQLEQFTGVLPKGTLVRMGPGSSQSGNIIQLAADTRLHLPAGTRLHLPEGGALWNPDTERGELADAVAASRYITQPGARLQAPLVALIDAWHVQLSEGTRIRLPADWAPPADWNVEEGQLSQATMIDLPAGTPMRGGPPVGENSGTIGAGAGWNPDAAQAPTTQPPTEPAAATTGDAAQGGWRPPVWAVIVVVLTALASAALWLHHRHAPQRSALARLRAPELRLHTRIDARRDDLPLAITPKTTAKLHLSIAVKPQPTAKPTRRATHATIHLDGKRLHRGPLATDGCTLALPALAAGDHALEVRVRTSRFARRRTLRDTIRVATWAEHVARDWQSLADDITRRTPLAAGATARQVRHALARLAPNAERSLGHTLVTGFEEASYSPRAIQESDWLRFAMATQDAMNAMQQRAAEARASTDQPRLLVPPSRTTRRAAG